MQKTIKTVKQKLVARIEDKRKDKNDEMQMGAGE